MESPKHSSSSSPRHSEDFNSASWKSRTRKAIRKMITDPFSPRKTANYVKLVHAETQAVRRRKSISLGGRKRRTRVRRGFSVAWRFARRFQLNPKFKWSVIRRRLVSFYIRLIADLKEACPVIESINTSGLITAQFALAAMPPSSIPSAYVLDLPRSFEEESAIE